MSSSTSGNDVRTSFARASLVLALCCSLCPLLAQAGAGEVTRYLRSVAVLYEGLQYERALEQLARARKSSGGPDDDLRIALWEGVLLAERGATEQALAAFLTAASLELDAELPVEVSPKVAALFRRAVEEARSRSSAASAASAVSPAPADDEAVSAPGAHVSAETSPGGGPSSVGAVKAEPSAPPSARQLAWLPATVGVIALGTGAGFWLDAKRRHDALERGEPASAEEADGERRAGRVSRNVGLAVGAAGIAALLTSGAMYLLGTSGASPTPQEVSVTLPGGHGVVVVWRAQLE